MRVNSSSPALCIVAAASLWACIGPLAKIAMAEGMRPLEVAFFRVCLGWLLFGGEALWRGKTALSRRDMPVVLLFGVVGVAGLFGTYVKAVQAGGAALASVLLYTAPAWVALLSRLLFKEPLTPRTLLAVALTMLGVAGVSFGAGGGDSSMTAGVIAPSALGFGLLAGLTYALYYIFGKHVGARHETATLFLYAMPVGALCLALLDPPRLPSATGLLACLGLAVLCTYGAYRIYYLGLRHLPATRAAVIATLEPVLAAALSYALFDEAFGWLGYAGGAAILLAVGVTVRR